MGRILDAYVNSCLSFNPDPRLSRTRRSLLESDAAGHVKRDVGEMNNATHSREHHLEMAALYRQVNSISFFSVVAL